MSDGAKFRTVSLVPGQHIIRALFAYADHVPYNNSPITDKNSNKNKMKYFLPNLYRF